MSESAPGQKALQAPPHLAVLQMLTARWISQAISAAAKLNIADQLANGPRSLAEIAAATGTHPPSLYRLLRALAGVGIFEEVGSPPETALGARRFCMTALAETLRSDVPNSMRGSAILLGEEWHARSWANLYRSVQSGETGFHCVFGEHLFEYLAKHHEALEIFHLAMKSFTFATQAAILMAYDFSGIAALVDVGGGSGNLLAAVLKTHPDMRGILYDSQSGVAGAEPILDAAGVSQRCSVSSGNFFESVPSGGDACILKHILHDWDDERAVVILKNCRRALPAKGKVLVVDAVIGPGNDPEFGKLLDLEMLIMANGGRERTKEEFSKLFAAAGFDLTRIMPTFSPVSILEGVVA